MPAFSIRARLTLWYSALLTITVLILAGAAYALLWYGSLQDMDDALQGVAQALEQQAPRRGNPFVPADVDALFRRFFGFSPWDRFVQHRDLLSPPDPRRRQAPSGTLPLSAEARRNAAAGRETYETLEGLADYPVRVLTKPGARRRAGTQRHPGGHVAGESVRHAPPFLWVMAPVLPFGLLLAAGGGWALARRALARSKIWRKQHGASAPSNWPSALRKAAPVTIGPPFRRLERHARAPGHVVSPNAAVQRRCLARTTNAPDDSAG